MENQQSRHEARITCDTSKVVAAHECVVELFRNGLITKRQAIESVKFLSKRFMKVTKTVIE